MPHPHHVHHRRSPVIAPDPAVVQSVISIGRQRSLSDDYILTALMVGLQESHLHNLNHGDGSSVGWRQETASSYGSVANRTDVPASVNRFYNELVRTPRGHRTLGHWGQAVQRSGYPDAYDPHLTQATSILQQYDANSRAVVAR